MLGDEEDVGPIWTLLASHRMDYAHPDVGQGAHRHAVGLALLAFALEENEVEHNPLKYQN